MKSSKEEKAGKSLGKNSFNRGFTDAMYTSISHFIIIIVPGLVIYAASDEESDESSDKDTDGTEEDEKVQNRTERGRPDSLIFTNFQIKKSLESKVKSFQLIEKDIHAYLENEDEVERKKCLKYNAEVEKNTKDESYIAPVKYSPKSSFVRSETREDDIKSNETKPTTTKGKQFYQPGTTKTRIITCFSLHFSCHGTVTIQKDISI